MLRQLLRGGWQVRWNRGRKRPELIPWERPSVPLALLAVLLAIVVLVFVLVEPTGGS